MSNDADTRTARNGARLSSGLRVVSRRGYGPTHERLSVCSCLGALGVNVRICRDPRFRLSQISWRTSGRITRRRTNLSACQALLCEDLLYIQLQGRAPRAGPEAGRRSGESAARQRRWLSSGAASAHSWLATRGPRRAGRRLPSFGPFGPRRRRRALSPAAGHMGSAPQRQRWRAGLQTGPSLRRPHSEALRARGQDRSLALASLRDPFGPLDRSAAGIQGRLSEGWPGPSATPPVAAVCSSRPGLSRLIAGHEYYKSARHAPSWPHWPYLWSSGSRVRILPGAPLPGAPGTTPSQTKISRRLTPTFDPAKGGAGSPAVAATSPPPGRRHRIGRAQPPRRVHLAGPCRSPSGRRCAMASPT